MKLITVVRFVKQFVGGLLLSLFSRRLNGSGQTSRFMTEKGDTMTMWGISP